jgi:glycosyltransferase involved in cell wall biosynthesis
LSFVIPFSYGPEGAYAQAVRSRVARSSKDFRFIEEFLPKEEYYDLVTRAKAAVFNSYRQMAMGNILPMLTSGVKIYLNTRNVIYHWLLHHGFHIYAIEDLAVDLQIGDLELGAEQKLANANAWRLMETKYSRETFARKILDIVARKQSEFPH